jgi:hypothetical protein
MYTNEPSVSINDGEFSDNRVGCEPGTPEYEEEVLNR